MTLALADRSPSDAPARRPWHPLSLLLVLALWLSTAGNLPLWRALWALTDNHGLRTDLGLLGFGLIVMAATTVLLSLLVWPRWRKPVGVLLLLVAVANSYFMHTYGVVIDPTMVANTVQTDVREVRDLLSWSLLAALALGVVLPGWWWWRQPVQQLPTRRLLGWQLGLAGLASLVTGCAGLGSLSGLPSRRSADLPLARLEASGQAGLAEPALHAFSLVGTPYRWGGQHAQGRL